MTWLRTLGAGQARQAAGAGPLFRPGSNVAVVQPLPGIGDMIWHLPHIRALAAAAGAPVTLVAKPGSAADQIFGAEPSLRRVLWLRRDGGALADRWRLVAELRAGRFDAAVVLHHSQTLAFMVAASGIRLRYGYGFAGQRWFLNRPPFLAAEMLPVHPYGQASAWIAAAGLTMEREPVLPVSPAASAAVRARLGGRRFVAVGIGSSEPAKQWGAARFTELIAGLRIAGWPDVLLLGGPAEAALADDIADRVAVPVVAALGWNLAEVAALLADAAFFVGNDTGTANMAAAVGSLAFVLFGATPPFDHAARIVPICPADGIDRVHGMTRITAAAVLAAISAGTIRRG